LQEEQSRTSEDEEAEGLWGNLLAADVIGPKNVLKEKGPRFCLDYGLKDG